ncbi:MAG: chromosomal replication initiator protein DnaA [Chloroflexota bacterium]
MLADAHSGTGGPLTTLAPSQLWAAALGRLQVEVPRPNFETWLKGTKALRYEDGCLVVGAASAFTAAMLEERLSGTIARALERVAEQPISVKFEVIGAQRSGQGELTPQPGEPTDPGASEEVPADYAEPPAGELNTGDGHGSGVRAASSAVGAEKSGFGSTPFNPRFNFEAFVVGPSNELAYAAASRVSMDPGRVYNPLYMYAEVGLGKTHLLQAIANELTRRGMEVIYVSSERFTNDYIRAIQEGKTESFRERYRSADALLVDDIQFIAGKAQTQEGFFHTFNELHMSGRQVVVTGDEPARQSLLEERIQSRLEGGLVVDIQPPNYETRMAILQTKCSALNVQLPKEVMDLIASRPISNVRELEGALNRVVAYGQMASAPITLEMTRRAMGDMLNTQRQEPITPSDVLQAVADHFATDVDTIKGNRRSKQIAQARHIAMYLLRETSELSSPQVGLVMGGKDHTTVLYAQRKVEQQMERDPDLRHQIATIRHTITSRTSHA